MPWNHDGSSVARPQARMAALDGTDVAIQLRDLRDMASYQDAPVRHIVSRLLIWEPSEVAAFRETLRSVVERKLYDAIRTLAARDPRVFLEPAARSELAALIDDLLDVTFSSVAETMIGTGKIEPSSRVWCSSPLSTNGCRTFRRDVKLGQSGDFGRWSSRAAIPEAWKSFGG